MLLSNFVKTQEAPTVHASLPINSDTILNINNDCQTQKNPITQYVCNWIINKTYNVVTFIYALHLLQEDLS